MAERATVARPYRPTSSNQLTTREISVVEAVSWGATNAEIARKLRISESTVKTHLRSAGVRLGVGDRAGIVGAAFRAGVIR